jgi:hypothetical protein
VLARKADGVKPAGAVNQSQETRAPQQTEQVRRIERVGKAAESSLAKVAVQRMSPLPAKVEKSPFTVAMQTMVEDLERGQGALDKLINGSLRGRAFSQTELLALQASMYKYSQELDLTSKVLEKATNGLKDTLKTQV